MCTGGGRSILKYHSWEWCIRPNLKGTKLFTGFWPHPFTLVLSFQSQQSLSWQTLKFNQRNEKAGLFSVAQGKKPGHYCSIPHLIVYQRDAVSTICLFMCLMLALSHCTEKTLCQDEFSNSYWAWINACMHEAGTAEGSQVLWETDIFYQHMM